MHVLNPSCNLHFEPHYFVFRVQSTMINLIDYFATCNLSTPLSGIQSNQAFFSLKKVFIQILKRILRCKKIVIFQTINSTGLRIRFHEYPSKSYQSSPQDTTKFNFRSHTSFYTNTTFSPHVRMLEGRGGPTRKLFSKSIDNFFSLQCNKKLAR